jgi:putative PIG3 family NAD(P)H quinone oxidoreductase
MRAVVITEPGAPEVLRLQDVADPEPAEGQIRVRVEAAGLNRADLAQRRGHYPAPDGWPEDIPGLEYAGVVEAVGPHVAVWSPGDRVMGLVGGGACAEYVIVSADEALPVPRGMDSATAAAVPEAFITAHDALRTRLGVRRGEALLIHAVGSGVGTAALQLARAWGVRVIGTSRTEWKLERATELGLDVAIRPENGTFADAVLASTGKHGVGSVLDLVGGDYLEENLRCTTTLGRIVLVGLTRGRSAPLDMGTMLRKRLTLVGTVLRSRSGVEKAAATRLFAEDATGLLTRREIVPVIHEVLPMEEAVRGHELLESNETFGNVVLKW